MKIEGANGELGSVTCSQDPSSAAGSIIHPDEPRQLASLGIEHFSEIVTVVPMILEKVHLQLTELVCCEISTSTSAA